MNLPGDGAPCSVTILFLSGCRNVPTPRHRHAKQWHKLPNEQARPIHRGSDSRSSWKQLQWRTTGKPCPMSKQPPKHPMASCTTSVGANFLPWLATAPVMCLHICKRFSSCAWSGAGAKFCAQVTPRRRSDRWAAVLETCSALCMKMYARDPWTWHNRPESFFLIIFISPLPVSVILLFLFAYCGRYHVHRSAGCRQPHHQHTPNFTHTCGWSLDLVKKYDS